MPSAFRRVVLPQSASNSGTDSALLHLPSFFEMDDCTSNGFKRKPQIGSIISSYVLGPRPPTSMISVALDCRIGLSIFQVQNLETHPCFKISTDFLLSLSAIFRVRVLSTERLLDFNGPEMSPPLHPASSSIFQSVVLKDILFAAASTTNSKPTSRTLFRRRRRHRTSPPTATVGCLACVSRQGRPTAAAA
jgi:hypothetical protein